MSLHALDSLDDSLDATRDVLPGRVREWLILAAIAPFLGTTGVAISLNFGGSGTGTGTGDGAAFGDGTLPVAELTEYTPLLLTVAGILVGLWLLFTLLGALFEFAFFETLRTGEVAVRRDVSAHWRKGLGLFGFRLVLAVVSFAASGAILIAAVQRAGGLDAPLFALLFALGAAAPLLLVIGIPIQLVGAFTTAFVVPTMLTEDRGVLSGWRRLLPVLRREWKEFAVYAVASAILVIAGGLLVMLAVGVVVFGLAALFGGAAVAVLVAGGGLAGLGLAGQLGLATLGIGALLVVLVAYAVALVPVEAYLRYYPLFVLGDVEETLDYIPERRREIRGGVDDLTDADTDPSEE